MDYKEKIRELLLKGKESDDYSEVEDFVENDETDTQDDKYEVTFRLAVQLGCKGYVDEHTGDVDINDGIDGECTYFDETQDEQILNILIKAGAMHSMDYYTDYPFAYETMDDSILNLDEDLQQEVLDRYMEKHGLTEDQILAVLNEEDTDIQDMDADDVSNDLDSIGVIAGDDGDIEFEEPQSGSSFAEILQDLGWDLQFEGECWKLNVAGVYYLNE